MASLRLHFVVVAVGRTAAASLHLPMSVVVAHTRGFESSPGSPAGHWSTAELVLVLVLVQ